MVFRSISLLLLMLVQVATVRAQSNESSFRLLQDQASFSLVEVNVGGLQQRKVMTPQGEAVQVGIHKGTTLLKAGAPEVPQLAFSLIIPNRKNSVLTVLDADYTEYSAVNLLPSKGKLYRDQKPSDVPLTRGPEYQQNAFYPGGLAVLQAPYILRDFRGQTVQVRPVQYNPVTKVLRVYHRLRIRVDYQGESLSNVLPEGERPRMVAREFDNIYAHHFLNYRLEGKRYTPLTQNGKILVLCPANYLDEIAPYVKWKRMKGYPTILVNTDTITGGVNENTVLNLVSAMYANQQIAYLVLVGDHPNIPARNADFMSAFLLGPSDNAYAYQSGNDHYPEFIVGRFSGESKDEIIVQVKRTLNYERTPNTASNWAQRQIGVASDQGPGDDWQYDHEHIREIMDSNRNQFTYVDQQEFFDGSQGGNDAAGSPLSTDILSAINTGAGLLNYCGHGSTDAFTTSGFSSLDIPGLTNSDGRWPVMFVTACLNGNFTQATCMAEYLLRAVDASGNPRGAAATLMSTILQSWDPPMQGQDEINAILRGARPGVKQTTFGALSVSGCMSVNDNYNTAADPNGGNEITDTWTVFGDPALEVRTKHDGALTCTHTAEIGRNSTWYIVNCPVEGATVGLYYQGEYLAASTVSGGVATFTFPAITNLDTVFVTATKQNYVPYMGYAKVVDFPTGLNATESAGDVLVYPNPVSDELSIEVSAGETIQRLELYDSKGAMVCSQQDLNAQQTKVHMQGWASGLYHCTVTTTRGVQHRSVWKK